MMTSLAEKAYEALKSDDSNWKRLRVYCEENRLLLIEANDSSKQLVHSYSKAFRSIVEAKRPITSTSDLMSLKNIGNQIAKIVVEDVWKYYPPVSATKEMPEEMVKSVQKPKKQPRVEENETDDDEDSPFRPKEKPQRVKQQKREYRPTPGSANYAFLICLLQALERGENELTKAVLMARAEKSGLSDSSIYGSDPLVQRQGPSFAGNSFRMICYTGWKSTATLLKQKPPLVKIYGRPKKVLLTPEGVELATTLQEEARAAGRLKELELSPPRSPKRLEPAEALKIAALDEHSPVEPIILDSIQQPSVAVLPRTSIDPQDFAVQETVPRNLPYSSPDAAFDDEFDLVMVVDQREQFSRVHLPGQGRSDALDSHLNVLRESGIEVSARQLEIGDAIWVARKKAPFPDSGSEYVLDWIVERKRVDDLAASIIDKRYEQQKYWLKQCGLSNVVYLVEGDPQSIDASSAVKTATASTELLDGFKVFRTSNYTESLKFYARMTDSIRQQHNNRFNRGSRKVTMTLREFEAQLKNAKKMSCKDIWGLMLTRIPGIGPDSAAIITHNFPTAQSLYQAYKEHKAGSTGLSFRKVLAEVRSEDTGKRIGPAKSEKLTVALLD